MDKVVASAAAAVADIPDGASLLFGGFGVVQGWPNSLLLALRDHAARDLTVIFNTPGVGPFSAQLLAEAGLVRKVIASFAAYPTRVTPLEEQLKTGRVELELVPQGTLAERVRAGGAGIPAFYTPTGVGRLDLRAGVAGQAKIGLKGKGPLLAVPALPIQDLPVTAQLLNSNGACWAGTFTTTRRNDAAQFKATSD